MTMEGMDTNCRQLKEGHYDHSERIAASTYDPANVLVGREHAQDTQLLWVRMDVNDNEADVRGCP